MSDRPDFTANTALNAVADTLDNLPVSINAQTLGSLAVDIAAQSAGDIDINLNTNSVGSLSTTIDGQSGDVGISFNSQTGNVDINFEDQTGGVESGTEFAARQGDSFTRDTRDILSPGDFISQTLFDNSTGGPVVLESLTMASFRDFTENSLVSFGVSTDDPFVDDVELIASPATAPFQFNPGIRIEDTGNIGVLLENNSSKQSTIEAQAVFREL
jgi:hypothetical protein